MCELHYIFPSLEIFRGFPVPCWVDSEIPPCPTKPSLIWLLTPPLPMFPTLFSLAVSSVRNVVSLIIPSCGSFHSSPTHYSIACSLPLQLSYFPFITQFHFHLSTHHFLRWLIDLFPCLLTHLLLPYTYTACKLLEERGVCLSCSLLSLGCW